MFTGLVEMTGVLTGRGAEHLKVRPARRFAAPVHGESVAVNGCCLTLERELPDGELEFFTLAETLKRTNLGSLKTGSAVNLERALKVGDRLGGHIVSGHIDAAAAVTALARRSDGDYELTVELPPALAPEMVEKGSVAIDGVSLTIVRVEANHFTVHLIPVTRAETALSTRNAGASVNLETDILGKYVRRQLELRMAPGVSLKESSITMDTLHEAGFL